MRLVLVFILLLLLSAQNAWAASIFTSPDKTNLGVNDELSISANLSISASDNTQYFLRGIFYQPGTSNYCGLTWNGNSWFSGPYSSNEGWKNFLPITIQGSSWSGTLRAKIDYNDSGCKESGNYSFKIQRFTSSGSGNVDDQNEIALVITVPTMTPTPAPTNTPTPTAKAVSTPTPTQKSASPTPTSTVLANAKSAVSAIVTKIPSIKVPGASSDKGNLTSTAAHKDVLGAQNSSNFVEVLGARSSVFPWWMLFFVAGGGIMLTCCGILGFRKYKERKNLEF